MVLPQLLPALKVFSMTSAGEGNAILPSTLQQPDDQAVYHKSEVNGNSTSTATAVAAAGSHLENNDNVPSKTMSKSGSDSTLKEKGSNGGVTFAHQDGLPKLPIPDLESTCRKYIESLVPLQSPREHEETRAAVEEFLKTDGPELQERLKKYASSKTSYIEQFWYDSYLNFDNSVVLNLNPFFLLEDDPTPARNNQVTRAASLVSSALSFVRAVRREELPPDKVKNTPLCMYQYSRLFGTARLPTENGCIIGQNAKAKHIVILCRGQFYWFDVLDDNNDLIMSEKDITVNLQVILDDAQQTPIQEAAKEAIGILSTENRKVWSGLRDLLTKDPGSNNAECLHIVDSAIFMLCLDHMEPASTADLCGNMLCGTSEIVRGVQIGTCINRWYDKLQIIVCQNGSAGINFEHTGVDGHTVLRFASDVYTDTILRYAKTINGQAPSLWASNSPDPAKRDPRSFGNVSTTPRKLQWDMIPELSIALRFAESHLADLLHQHEFQVLDFSGYGKNFITSAGFSPDAFVQMAFQAAYYGLYGRVENTYEPAMTKMFLHGRTEAIRPVTNESVDYVKTFWGDNPAEVKVAALKRATEKHTAITKECAKAQGQDRHLYALYCVWQRSVDGVSSIDESVLPDEKVPCSLSLSEENGGYTSSDSGRGSVSSARSNSSSNSSSSGRPARTTQSPSIPAIFNDSGWDKTNNTILSTSNCGNPALRHFGFGPTSGDGFGIGYIIKDDSISICASSKHRQTSRLMDTLESYLLEIRKLIRATSRKTTSPRTSRAREMEILSERLENRRGRLIRQDISHHGRGEGADTPTTDSGEVEDDGMGGYGFFDAGMLLHALKGAHSDRQRAERGGGEHSERRRPVGKKLQLADY